MFLNLEGCDNPKDYMQKKLTNYFRFSPSATSSRIAEIVNNVFSESLFHADNERSLPIADTSEFPILNEAQTRLIKIKKETLLKTLETISPLLKGESIVEERFSFFKENYAEINRNAPILIRKTNLATLAYVFNNAEITNNGDFKYLADSVTKEEIESLKALDSTVENICENLVKGIAGELPVPLNIIGSALLDGLFPGDSGIDYKQLIDDFSQIVKEANREQTVTEQDGILNGVLTYMKNTYSPLKKDGEHSDKLIGYLNDQQLKLQDVLGILGQDNYAKAGLAYYLPATDLQVSIYQEMALVNNPTNPKKSSYVQVLVNNLNSCKRQAQATASAIKTDIENQRDTHLGKISGVKDNPYCDGCGSGVVCKDRYYYTDDSKGYRSGYYEQSGCKDDPQKRCQTARNKYYNSIKKGYNDKINAMQWIFNTITKWTDIINNPIPVN